MAEDYLYINTTGTIVPDTAVILTGVEDEYKTTFGANLVVSPSTPQGALVVGETLARDAVVRNNAALANQINPNIAGGVFLDGICALTGLERDSATKSYVLAQVTGVAATIIPEASIAKTVDGLEFVSTESVTLDGSGNGEVTFQSVDFGPVPALAGTLTGIVSAVLGWDSINNADDAILGTTQQTDQNLRALRKVTLALQGVALSEAIISAVYAVPEVRSLSFRENETGTDATIDGIFLLKNSIYVCVDGGTNTDIATALLANKSLGCNWNGTESVNVTDPSSGQIYNVKFARPRTIHIGVKAYVNANTALINPTTATKQAILDYANGLLEGEAGLVVGANVSSFELAGAVNRETPGIYVQKIETTILDTDGDSYSSNEIPIGLDEIASIIESDIQVILI